MEDGNMWPIFQNRGLETQRYMLKDTKFQFKVQTDYKNLKCFIKVQKLNWKQVRWVLYLSRLDFTLIITNNRN